LQYRTMRVKGTAWLCSHSSSTFLLATSTTRTGLRGKQAVSCC